MNRFLDPDVLRPGAAAAAFLLLPVVWWGLGAGLGLFAERWLRRRHGLPAADVDAAGGRGAAGVAVFLAASVTAVAATLLADDAVGGTRLPGWAAAAVGVGCGHALATGLFAMSLKVLRPAVPRREVLAAAAAATGAWLALGWAAAWGAARLFL